MSSYQYDRLSGQYRDLSTGRYVGRPTIQAEVSKEAASLRQLLRDKAQAMLSGNTDVFDFQLSAAQAIKESSLRMAIFAKGGKDNMDGDDYLRVGRSLKAQYKLLHRFGKSIAAGELTEKQIIQRAGQYANSSTSAYYEAERVGRAQSGFNVAKRELDSQAQHCASCLQYSTDGKWLPIDQVVPSGVDCECGGHCKCRVNYKVISYLGAANLADLIGV